MKKRDLVDQCPGIYKLLTFCSNVWMSDNLTDEQRKELGIDDSTKAITHHDKEQTLKLMRHLKKEGAVYG